MILDKLDLFHVRNIAQAQIHPSSRLNLVYGKNASGKSSLLEAIYILGMGKSFRSSSIRSVISFDQAELIVSGQIITNANSYSHLGIKLDGKNCHIKIDRENQYSRSALAYALPIQLIHPKSYKLLDSGPGLRREYLDWGIFNQHQDFLLAWRKFKKSLQQRNILLKNKQRGVQIEIWNRELARYGTIVSEYREKYLKQLEPLFKDILSQFLDFENIAFKYYQGWDGISTLQEVLSNEIDKDLRFGFTHSGPHRGDFQCLINNKSSKNYISRGQLKIMVLALKLSQLQLLNELSGNSACVLIDDLAAELDATNRSKLLMYLSSIQNQVFLTSTELNDFGDLSVLDEYKMFHVEHGKINQM